MPIVFIPSAMRELSHGVDRLRVEGATIRRVVENVELVYPGFKERIFDEEGADLAPGLAVAINSEATSLGLYAPVGENDEVHFIPAIGGGSNSGFL